jgi:hypothetical protein
VPDLTRYFKSIETHCGADLITGFSADLITGFSADLIAGVWSAVSQFIPMPQRLGICLDHYGRD